MRVALVLFFILFAISVVVDIIIWANIRSRHPKGSVGRKVYAISSILLWVYFLIIGWCYSLQVDGMMNPTTVMWMLYSYLTVYCAKIIYVIGIGLAELPRIWKGRRKSAPLIVFACLGLGVLGLMWWGALYNRHQIDIVPVEINSSKLPDSFDHFRIVQISDLHVGTWGNDTTFVSSLVDSVNNLRPDVIFFTGDLVNSKTDELMPFVDILSRLHARNGVFSVLGNHDYGLYTKWPNEQARLDNNKRLAVLQRRMGWNLLKNEHDFIVRGRDTIAVIGVENWGEGRFNKEGDLDKAYPPVPAKDGTHQNDHLFKILLTHNPEHWRLVTADKSNIDLTLSGHTHAMQMMLRGGDWKWSPSEYMYPYWAGLYSKSKPDGTVMYEYVNIGAGTVGFPARIGATPEITLITLKKDRLEADK